jgi:uncharacterized damage-inducible protein DinB
MQLQPEQALFMLNAMLPSFEREHQTTVQVMQAVPADKAEYRPEPIAKSAYELAWHIAASENRFLGGIAAGEFDFTSPERVKTMPEVIEWHKQRFGANLAAIKKMTGEQLSKAIDFRGMFQMPAVAFLTLSSNHSIHHRGQLSVYLRPMGGQVPAIYGESYDSAARKAAQG